MFIFLLSHSLFMRMFPPSFHQAKFLMNKKNCNTFGLFFLRTGGWMRKGLGTVKTIEGKLLWTFSAPHLGYWIAASASTSTTGKSSAWLGNDALCYDGAILHPLFSISTMCVSSGLTKFSVLVDFLLHHSSFLLVILGGIIFIAACLLRGIIPSSRLNKLVVSSE